MLLVHLLEGAWPCAHLELVGKLAGAPALHLLPFLPDFISSCTGRSGAEDQALGKEGWLGAEHEVVAASLL